MGSLLLSTLPYAVAAAFAAPIVLVISAIILGKAQRPLFSVFAFTAAAGSLDAAFAAIVLIVFWGSADGAGGDGGAVIDIALGVLFVGMGIMAIFQHDSPERDAARRQRIDGFLGQGLRGVIILGFVAQIINFDAIAVFGGGLKEIIADQPPVWQAVAVVAVMLAVMLIPYYGPGVVYACSPQRAGKALARMSEWLLANARWLEIIVGIGYGSIFLGKGITAL